MTALAIGAIFFILFVWHEKGRMKRIGWDRIDGTVVDSKRDPFGDFTYAPIVRFQCNGEMKEFVSNYYSNRIVPIKTKVMVMVSPDRKECEIYRPTKYFVLSGMLFIFSIIFIVIGVMDLTA